MVTAGSTSTNFISGSAVFANNLVYGSKTDISVSTAGVATQVTDLLKLTSTFDGSKYASSLFANPYIYGTDFAAAGAAGNADFTLSAGSAAATGAAFTNAKVSGTFFDKVDYRGAFGTTNWASGWAQVDAQTLAYTTPGAVK